MWTTSLFTGVIHFKWRADCDRGYRRQDSICTSWAPVHHAVRGRSDVGGLHWNFIRSVSVFPLWPKQEDPCFDCFCCKMGHIKFINCVFSCLARCNFCVIRWWRRSCYCLYSLHSFSLSHPACLCVLWIGMFFWSVGLFIVRTESIQWL